MKTSETRKTQQRKELGLFLPLDRKMYSPMDSNEDADLKLNI